MTDVSQSSHSSEPSGIKPQLRILRSLLTAELAAGIGGLKLFMGCVAIATFMIVGVWILGNGLAKSLTEGGTTFLGGDLAVSVVNVPLEPTLVGDLRALGDVAVVSELRSSARMGDQRVTVEIKGVDQAYPLYGVVKLQSGRPLADALAPQGGMASVVVEPEFLRRVQGSVGDTLRLGEQDFVVTDALLLEPDRLSAGRFMVGPRLLLNQQDLQNAGLIQRGSIVDFRYRIKTPDGQPLAASLAQLKTLQADRGWEIETPEDAGDRVRRTVERTTTFLGMAGIVALAIGLAGAWAAAKAWISRRARTIALYRLSGAGPGLVCALHAVIIGFASLGGIIGGVIAAVASVLPVKKIIASQLHLAWDITVIYAPLASAWWIVVIGVTGTSVLVLGTLRNIRPGAAMRDGEVTLSTDGPSAVAGLVLVFAAMIGATLSLPIPFIAGVSVAGICLTAGLLAAVAAGLARLGASLRSKGFVSLVVHKGLTDTASVAVRAVAIGIGIAGITAITSAQTSLETALRSELPDRIPDLVLIDVQPDQTAPIRQRIESDKSLGGLQADPFMRATITAINGVPAADALIRENKSWVIEGDRSFSWSAEPTGAELLAGSWWPADYSGPSLVSPEEDLYEAFDLKPGDTITYSVLGRLFTSEVANIRKEYHRTFRPEYLMVASPIPFKDAPQSWVMSLQGDTNEAVDQLIRDLASDHGNVTSIDIRRLAAQVLQTIDGAIGASLLVALTLMIAGGLSIASVTLAEVDARHREALVFALVGASRSEIALARLVEASAIGLIAAVVGGGAGILGGYFAATEALHIAWSPGTIALILPLVLGLLAAMPAALAGGLGALPRGRGQMARHLSN